VDGCAENVVCASTTRRRGTEGKRLTVNSGLTNGRISGNIMHFRSVAKQYTPDRFAPVARHITRRACSSPRGVLLKAKDYTVATPRFEKTSVFVLS